ncbi:hypothetical protein K435DRAFT_591462, partial [Dendrothele bispora CBS 962.96]
FPGRRLSRPGPLLVDGHEEFTIDRIIDARKRDVIFLRTGYPLRGWQFLIRWSGYVPEEDRWL